MIYVLLLPINRCLVSSQLSYDEVSLKSFSVEVQPMIKIELEEACIWSLDWANSELVAVGCTNGMFLIIPRVPVL